MKIALLGTGRIGRYHAEVIASVPGIALTVYDVDPAAAAQTAARVGGHAARDVDAALGVADAVVIAAATNVHAELIRRGLQAHLPVFCEKPLAGDLNSTIAVAREVEQTGTPFQLGFQRRFDPAYREARTLVQSGELGTVYAVRLAAHDPAPSHESYIPASGGLFRDFAIHDFDMIRWLTGSDVEEVYADGGVRGFPVFAKYGDVDTGVAALRLANGVIAVLTAARHDPLGYDIRTELFGSRDSVTIGLGPRTPMRSLEPGVPPPAGPVWANFLERFDAAYRAEIEAFIRLARGEIPSPCTAADGLAALRIAEAATWSLHEHRPIRLEEIPG